MEKDENIGYYNLLDTKNTKEIRTVINLESIPMLDQFAAQGHDTTRKEWIKEKLSEPKWNYSHRLWIKQILPDDISHECIINIIDGSIEIDNEVYPYTGTFIEADEEELDLELDKVKCDLPFEPQNKGVKYFKRQRFHIGNRHDKIQPQTDCGTNLYDESEINWNVMKTKLSLYNNFKITSMSRKASFKVMLDSLRGIKLCKGALIEESDENYLDDFFEIKH